MNITAQRFWQLLVLVAILINATGLLNEILEPDGALYATISKRMVLTGDWLNLYGNGSDWLDKPHLPFWAAAASMQCLGITAFAYKLPAFLCFLLGLWYTWKLTALLYNEQTAWLTTVIYATALHTALANFDVRAEPYLTAFIVAATYHLYCLIKGRSNGHLLLASCFAALAIMTKGIFVLFSIGAGFVVWWMLTGQWKELVRPRWWIFLLLTLLLITPELYALYTQFDLHPEKMVFGKTGVSGIRFFFWDSQFGRFFNNGPIKGNGDLSFFLHTTLWAFLPWSVFLYIAVVKLFRTKDPSARHRWIIWGAAAFGFLLFSFSRFQLPHYIVIFFPHFSMICAAYLLSVTNGRMLNAVRTIQYALMGILVILFILLVLYPALVNPWILLLLPVATVLMLLCRKTGVMPIAGRGLVFAALLFVFLNLFFYPSLLHYQAGMEAGKWMKKTQAAARPVMWQSVLYSFEFYAPGLVEYANTREDLERLRSIYGPLDVLLPENLWPQLRQFMPEAYQLKQFDHFHISQLTGPFLNPASRQNALEKFVLVRIQ